MELINLFTTVTTLALVLWLSGALGAGANNRARVERLVKLNTDRQALDRRPSAALALAGREEDSAAVAQGQRRLLGDAPTLSGPGARLESRGGARPALWFALAVPALVVGLRGIVRRDTGDARLALLGCMPALMTLTAFAFTGQVRYHFRAMPSVIVAAS